MSVEVQIKPGLSFRVNEFFPPDRFPTPKQAAALAACNRGERVLYGGAAGGGKTDCLLMAALQFVHCSEYKAVIIRRTYPQLVGEDGILTRARAWGWAQRGAVWRDRESMWVFPSGARIAFRHLDLPKHADDYQGKELHFVGLDEVTQWADETLALYPATRLRRNAAAAAQEIPLRLLATANPGGAGHTWVKRRWIKPGAPRHRFVPARMADNPYIDGEEYRARLKEQGALLYRRLAEGDWDAEQGDVFRADWFKIAPHAPPGVRWVHSVDLASSLKRRADRTASGFIGIDAQGNLWIDDLQAWRAEWPEGRARLKARILARPVPVVVEAIGGYQIAAQDLMSDPALLQVPLRAVKHKGDKLEMAAPWAARAEAGRVYVVDGAWVNEFLDECAGFPDGAHDDLIDVVSQGNAALAVPQGGLAVGAPRQTTSAYHGGAHRRAGY